MMDNFHFIRPLWLSLLIPFIAVVFVNWKNNYKNKEWVTHIPKHLSDVLLVGQKSRGKNLPIQLLGVLGLVAIIVAAGPSWYRQASPFAEDTTPLVVVLDVSDSMMQNDLAPSRLYRAKQKISSLIELQGKGKTALIAYSGSAHLAMPLTQDIEVFKPLLQAIKPEVMPREGKFAQYTLPIVDQIIPRDSVAATVLLVTDALNQRALSEYHDYFNARGYQLLVYGIGNPNVESVLPVETEKLSMLAEAANGELVLFTPDDQDILRLSDKVTAYAELSSNQAEPWFDASYPLVWVLVIPYLLWFRKGWLVQWSVFGLALACSTYSPQLSASEFSMTDLWLTKNQQGALHYQQQEYLEAAKDFQTELLKAGAYYQAGDYETAQQFYMRSDTLQGHLGVAACLAQQKEFVAAREHYRDIVNRYPSNHEAQHNLKVVEAVIAYIDKFTEQQSKSNERQVSRENGDKPQRADGVKQEVEKDQIIEEHLSAEEILNDPNANEKWMKRVQSDLSIYLAKKFSLQYQHGQATTTEWRDGEE
ncbi:vWA domain-containing protein [Vibrio fortis]|uniref:vWA domain-containing protein n=1 Tax=Vibrio fortis TaxID=212667 RepID=UPI0021C30E0D|nr:VWA domain-containing protein [Vibrio fortis]